MSTNWTTFVLFNLCRSSYSLKFNHAVPAKSVHYILNICVQIFSEILSTEINVWFETQTYILFAI